MALRDEQWGSIEIERDKDTAPPSLFSWLDRDPSCQAEMMIWRPPRDLSSQVPDRLALPIRCFTTQEGVRCFSPLAGDREPRAEGGIPTFFSLHLTQAWAAGLGLLCREHRLEAEQRQSYRLMWLIFLRVRRMREHVDRRFSRYQDLFLNKKSRLDRDEVDLLSAVTIPETWLAAVDRTKLGHRIEALAKQGKIAAVADGILKPSIEECLKFGLLEAVKAMPWKDDVPDAVKVVRNAIYDYWPAEDPPDRELQEIVLQRLIDAIGPHLDDEPEKFNKWYWGSSNTLFKQLARGKEKPGGDLEIDQVRRAMLELGWNSYAYVAGCLSLQMQAFAKSLPTPLAPKERQIFEWMHLKQDCWGKLCLLLLAERMGFVDIAVRDVIKMPGDPVAIGTFHRMLRTYALIATNRRVADNRSKEAPVAQLDEDHDMVGGVASPGRFRRNTGDKLHLREQGERCKEIGTRLAEKAGVMCRCQSKGSCWEADFDHNAVTGKGATISLRCRNCNYSQDIDVDIRDLGALMGFSSCEEVTEE